MNSKYKIIIAALLLATCPLPAQQQASPLEAEVISVSPKYVHPAQITRRAGPFLLVIKNYSPLKRLVLNIKPRGGAGSNAVHQADLDQSNGSYQAVLDLPSGAYDITEPSNPALKCTITIR